MAEGARGTSRPPGAADPLIGRSINDRFTIKGLIARGGMGKVYRAEQAPLGRLCAVKVLNPNYTGEQDPEFHRRFFLEASIASKLTHPNTVTIFDYGKTDDDIYYMAMEYLDGVTLHRAIREAGFFHEDRVAHIGRQVCRALREAHSIGVIHRDLKPANIFLVEHGDEVDFVKVLDFGLVKHIEDAKPEDVLTQTGLFMGSPKYMAPEQIRGERVDARTDVYALGVILYEMLTGKVPFDRPNSLNILMAQVSEQVPPLAAMNAEVSASPQMEELVMRCMAKEPGDRPKSMDEVLAVLKRIGAGAAMGTGEFRPVTGSGANAQLDASGAPSVSHGPGHSMLRSSFPPPHLSSQAPSATPPPMYGPESGSQRLPVPAVHAAVLAPPDAEAPPIVEMNDRRSRRAVIAGAVGALALVGAVLAFAMNASVGGDAASGVRGASGAPVSAGPGLNAATSPSSPPPVPVTLRLSTDPTGAGVKEDGKEICAATPCDYTVDADPTKEHKLTFAKGGFRTEARVVHSGDGPVTVRLARQSGWSPPPPRPPPPPPVDKDPPTAPGFKALPY